MVLETLMLEARRLGYRECCCTRRSAPGFIAGRALCRAEVFDGRPASSTWRWCARSDAVQSGADTVSRAKRLRAPEPPGSADQLLRTDGLAR